MDFNFLIDMAWKSALIAGAALGLTASLRSRAPADRVLVLRIGASLLLALPAAMLLLPSLDIAAFSAPEPATLAGTVDLSPLALALLASGGTATAPTLWDDPTPLVVLLYLGGLAWAGSRLLAGLVMLHLWTRGAHRVACPEWQAAFERTRWTAVDAEKVRLLVSDEVASPLSWGWSRPTILIDRETLRHPEDADAILAHEMAHIARGDWPLLLLIRAAAALFWFNPLVWLLEREAVQQAEEAADLAAAERVEPVRYAETLLNWAQCGAPAPVTALAIAPSARSLGRRIRAVLDRRERPAGSAWTALAMLACLGLAAPVAAMRLVAAQPEAPEAPPAPPAPEAPPAPAAPAAPATPAAPDAREIVVEQDGRRIVITLPDGEEIARTVNAAVARVRIPEASVRAMAAARPEIARALRKAQVELARAPHVSGAAIEAAMADALRHSGRAQIVSREQMVLAMREAARVRREVHRDVQRSVRQSIAAGADGMLRGADGMEGGARHMEQEAQRLQDPAYRERCIERARARGETVTHEQLIEAAREMREGAEGMREGARDMREAAEDMRRDARDHDDDDG